MNAISGAGYPEQYTFVPVQHLPPSPFESLLTYVIPRSVQSAGDPEQNGAVPIHIPGSANASLVSKIAVTAKTILNRIIEASLSVTDVEGLQGGYPDPPQKIFEQPETPVKKDPHVARLTSGQSRSLLSFSFMISRRDFGRGGDL